MDLVSPRPFWPLKNGLLSVYPALKQDLSCDVVVLGAGITGAFIAQCLAEEGFDTVVLDKRDVCAGSTSANTALLQYELDISLVDLTKRMGRRGADQVYRVCHDSITAIEHLVHRHNLGCVYRRRQSVYLASHRSEAPLLREEWSARRAHSRGRRRLSPSKLRSWTAIDWHMLSWRWRLAGERVSLTERRSKSITPTATGCVCKPTAAAK